jgi:pimeloyl-ACP methyl ester carboxylesterase
MAVIFVHGVPETAAIWDLLLAELGRDDAVTLSPPGFGAPVPDGFGATSDDYRDWLIAEVEKLSGGPHDLIGHDWGGGHVARLVAARPDLARSWATDIAGTFDPEYVWHDMAQVWQTEGPGEELVGVMFSGPPGPRAEALVQAGMTGAAAQASAEQLSPQTGQCMLALYRSARQPAMATWGQQLEAAQDRPLLVINATADPYVGGRELAHRTAERLGGQEAVLDGLSHWWMLHDPAQGAAVIRDFLASLPDRG